LTSSSIHELVKLTGGSWEKAIDELVNVSFDVTQESHDEMSPDALAAAREHLSRAGRKWAATVAVIATLEEETLEEESLDRINRARLGAALDRIGHQGSSIFRDRLAAAFAEATR
jgi:hypothetical protein